MLTVAGLPADGKVGRRSGIRKKWVTWPAQPKAELDILPYHPRIADAPRPPLSFSYM
jgi:hypothetical protein